MKKLYIELQFTKEGIFEPIVKLTGNYAEGISFDSNVKTISREYGTHEHLSGSNKIKVSPISFATYLSASPPSGAKAILMTCKEDEKKFFKGDFINKYVSRTSTIADEEKKILLRCDCNAASYISRNGENNQLCRCACKATSIDNINECARYLIKKIELLLTNSYIVSEIIKLTFRGGGTKKILNAAGEHK